MLLQLQQAHHGTSPILVEHNDSEAAEAGGSEEEDGVSVSSADDLEDQVSLPTYLTFAPSHMFCFLTKLLKIDLLERLVVTTPLQQVRGTWQVKATVPVDLCMPLHSECMIM